MSVRSFIFISIIIILFASCRTDVSSAVVPDEPLETASLEPKQRSGRDMLLPRGSVAPDFVISDFNGEKYQLSENRGKGVVVNFWASWCQPCRWEMPFFEENWKEYQDNLSFVGIAVSDYEDDARAFADLTEVTYPNGLDDGGEIASMYKVSGMPTTYFIDKDGLIVRGLIGATNEGTLKWFIENLFKDRQ